MGSDKDLLALGREIRRCRKLKGLSQERLAELVDLHRNYIGLLERGEREAPIGTVIALARALGVKPAELLVGIA